jgi:hypothetical protein
MCGARRDRPRLAVKRWWKSGSAADAARPDRDDAISRTSRLDTLPIRHPVPVTHYELVSDATFRPPPRVPGRDLIADSQETPASSSEASSETTSRRSGRRSQVSSETRRLGRVSLQRSDSRSIRHRSL